MYMSKITELLCRGFIRSRELAKIAAYFDRIYLILPPTLSALIFQSNYQKIHQFAAYFSYIVAQTAIAKLIENPACVLSLVNRCL